MWHMILPGYPVLVVYTMEIAYTFKHIPWILQSIFIQATVSCFRHSFPWISAVAMAPWWLSRGGWCLFFPEGGTRSGTDLSRKFMQKKIYIHLLCCIDMMYRRGTFSMKQSIIGCTTILHPVWQWKVKWSCWWSMLLGGGSSPVCCEQENGITMSRAIMFSSCKCGHLCVKSCKVMRIYDICRWYLQWYSANCLH